ncbi:hypothetical protein BDV37DRAFT_276070 [Aspergillus pseudonomiae]|uniref:Rhodopsin domain-containing protein n=1 Tax=Aspergillus pseudonomiae TaxID=1506151 RepID=A0A5N7CWB9_9EURO|nr:uncharacterized protein BDV37DRAFT_276070 [Aspergillus pseudonomiae]KAE8398485.1 hypothetical protein BDV37DRAFT_276070 [Aspergillus pseudonomiae]
MVSIQPGSQQDLQVGSYVIFGVAMIMIGMRLYARQFLLGKLGSDDILIILASLASIGELVTVPKMYECGIGRHLMELTLKKQECTRKWAWISQVLYFLSLGLAKGSMVALYVRLASNKTHIRFLYGVRAVILSHGIAATLVASFICEPISVLWGPESPQGCLDLMSFNYFNGAFHVTTDILLALLPIPIVKKLQTNNRRKIGLIIAFGIGILTICASIARQVTTVIALRSRDFQWNWSAAELTTSLEINMSLICASVPAMRSLFKVYFGSTGLTNRRAYEHELNDRYTHGSGARKAFHDFSNVEETQRQTRTNTVTSRPRSMDSFSAIMYGAKDGVVQTTEFRVSYGNRASLC